MVLLVPVNWAVASTLAIIASPFGTHAGLSLEPRMLFWPLVIGVAILVGIGLQLLLRRAYAALPARAAAVVLACLITLVLTPMFNLALGHVPADAPELVPHWARVGGFILVAAIGVSALCQLIMHRNQRAEHGAKHAGKALHAPRLLARIEPALRAPLVRLSGQDHYVEVSTEAGTARVLMRFADALREVEGVDGLQVHRSHWVARRAIIGTARNKSRHLLVLSDGTQVPLSKSFRQQVLAQGLPHGH